MIAADKGHVEVVSQLVRAGAGLDIQNDVCDYCHMCKERVCIYTYVDNMVLYSSQYGDTALIFATVKRHTAVLRVLISAGADLNHTNEVY